jgi:hypothetical protein
MRSDVAPSVDRQPARQYEKLSHDTRGPMSCSLVRLNHAVLFVAELGSLVSFDQSAFGMEIVTRELRARATFPRLPRSRKCNETRCDRGHVVVDVNRGPSVYRVNHHDVGRG